MNLVCWFNENTKQAMNIVDNLQSAKQADYWHVTADNLPSSPDPTGPALRYAISALLNDADARKTVNHHTEHTQWLLNHVAELRPNIVWRFLEHRGYVNTDHTLSAWGKALNVALEKAENIGSFRCVNIVLLRKGVASQLPYSTSV